VVRPPVHPHAVFGNGRFQNLQLHQKCGAGTVLSWLPDMKENKPMKHFNLALLGFGNVGRALAGLLQSKRAELREKYGIEWRVTGVASRRLGWLANPDGFGVDALLANNYQSPITAASIQDWLSASRADVLFENSSLNPLTGQPAIDHVKAGLEHGAHVITANKYPVTQTARLHCRRVDPQSSPAH
jgi:homoserine dehydrogenase